MINEILCERGSVYMQTDLDHCHSLIDIACFSAKLMLIFLFLLEDTCCRYSLEVPQWEASNKNPQHFFSWRNKKKKNIWILIAGLGVSVGWASDWRLGGRGFDPRQGRQHSFLEIDHEIFSTVILSLPLIQEGQLSVSGERRHNTG